MLIFSPAEIKDSIIGAIKKLPFLKGDIEDIEFSDFLNFDKNKYDDCDDFTIGENSSVYLHIGEDNYPSITVAQFINLAQEKDHLKINSTQSYAKSNQEVYFLLESSDYSVAELLSNTFRRFDAASGDIEGLCVALEKETVVDGKSYRISLFNGFCIYHLLVEESGNFDEYYPSYSPYDYFVRISCQDGNIDMSVADALAVAYVFELQAAFDISLPFSSGRTDVDIVDRSDESLLGLETHMFPLIYGVGAAELLGLYNTAKVTVDLDFKILGFTKVIEYIAPTITQKELIESVSLKLSSLSVFKPTAAFISELGAIYDKHRNTTTKDSELIKLSILTAVTLDEIWEKIPSFLKGKLTSLPSELEHSVFLEKIAECIYSTRNEIAHAKANYEKRGTECPVRYKSDFCVMLDAIAVRCIRWFALQPEDKRVVLR